jgi:hypothetical protein
MQHAADEGRAVRLRARVVRGLFITYLLVILVGLALFVILGVAGR